MIFSASYLQDIHRYLVNFLQIYYSLLRIFSAAQKEFWGFSAPTNALKSVSTSVPASVGLCSLDGRKLGRSSRLVLTYLTREANIGMAISPDDEIVAGQGSGPIALEKGILKARIALDAKKNYAVYPLAFNGERREKIPFDMSDGVMEIRIDNSKLKNGATPFFEIVAE